MAIQSAEAKVQLGKYLEAAYSTDKGLFGQIVLEKGLFRMTVDQQGNGLLTGSAGSIRFSGRPAPERVGVAMSPVTVDFQNGGRGRIAFRMTLKVGIGSGIGTFDPEALILSCSGYLCQAARTLKNQLPSYQAELQSSMGY